jgi:hypothetical protein
MSLVNLQVGQIWLGRTRRTKTITTLIPQIQVRYIDGNDGQEWSQDWATFKAWIEISNAKPFSREELEAL